MKKHNTGGTAYGNYGNTLISKCVSQSTYKPQTKSDVLLQVYL